MDAVSQARIDELNRRINELLNEEKWTRATLANYTINNFKELDVFLAEVGATGQQELIKQACLEHLHHTKNSIIALYISGLISLSQQLVDDTNIVLLINIFSDNHKWNIVEYLCNQILRFGENKYVLRTLAECYANENENDRKFEIWERLIRVDYEEADIVKSLAERMEQAERLPEAVDYYKKALHRFINKKAFNSVREVWDKLIAFCPEETEFFYHAEKKVAKLISPDRAVQLLEALYPYFKREKRWDNAIDLLKHILEYDSKSSWGRKEIAECFREKYSGHSQLEEYIRVSNLTASWRSVQDAIADFEKHIAFDAGNFVYHRTWGVGRIQAIKEDNIIIDFVKHRDHSMKLKMAVSSLSILGKQHIWVLKTVMKKEKLREKVKTDIAWALKTIISSLGNAADMKAIKAELVPSVLTAAEWTGWSGKARDILKEDTNFGNLPDKLDTFIVRDQPISFHEKTLNIFKAEKDFFDRVQTLQEYIGNKNQQPETDYFGEMFEYFLNFIRSYSVVNEFVISSALLVRKIVSQYSYLNPGINIDFKDMFQKIENVQDVFTRIENAELKREYLLQLRRNADGWAEHFISIFPNYLQRFIIDDLLSNGYEPRLIELFSLIAANYREYREPFVWLCKNFFNDGWYEKIGVPYEKVLIGMIHLLDITFRDIDNRRDPAVNRKINKQIVSFLFTDGHIAKFVQTAGEESLVRIYTLMEDIKNLDPAVKIDLRHKIMERFPSFHFLGGMEKETVASRGFYVASTSYEAKQKQLQHILDVEVPANSKEIGQARDLGDLRENAEYKAAKEKQELLNSAVAKLKEELERAQIVHPRDVNSERITFGTRVQLLNKDSGAKEEFVILGPWESDPNKRIISYLSPLGGELFDHAVGDELRFTINERSFNYRIEQVSPVDF